MEMKKKLYLLLGLVLLIIIGVLFYLFLIQKSAPQAEKINIQTAKGSFPINDVQKNPSAEKLSPTDTLAKSTPDYDIVFFDINNNKSFLISIKSPDIESARKKAEFAFLQTLGISQSQACQLTVSLTVPYSVNQLASGSDYGLSFCPNGNPFPK